MVEQLTVHPVAEGPSSPPPYPSASASGPRRRARVDSNSSAPDPKRFRTSDATSKQQQHTGRGIMSAKMQGKLPERVNLMRTPALQPLSGAKKLVIKNMRPASRAQGVDDYYKRTWAEIEEGLSSIFAGIRPRVPLERIYRGVEDLCRNNQGDRLYELLRRRCEDYLNGETLAKIKSDGSSSNLAMLRSVYRQWKTWNSCSMIIRSTFSYLDRTFVLNSKKHPQVNDMLITHFRKMVFGNHGFRLGFTTQGADSNPSSPGSLVLAGICELVEYDRRGDAQFDSQLLRESVTMLHIFNIYDKAYEPRFLKESNEYFEDFAEERSQSYSLKDYIASCERLLKSEDYRCNVYNFDSTTKKRLLDDAHAILIDKYSSKLLDSGSVGKLLDANEIESLKALYDLLRLTGIQKRLKGPWEAYIEQTGASIVTDKERGDEMVIRLLQMRKTLDVLIRDAFNRDEEFTYGLREAFAHFINDKNIESSWGTGTSKVGEMIAKYVDLLLRGGLKSLPKSLLSDNKDRDEAERSGQASAGDEDAELDRLLDQALELFRFIEGKDVFEAFYKKDLARRLLMGRSASQDAERNMLTKLKNECGSTFTRNLEQMFKDQELAKDEMASYKQWREGTGNNDGGLDLTVSILSAAAWPTYPDVKMLLPDNVAEQIDRFDRYYKNKHTGRKLSWKHNLAHCHVKASFPKGSKELLVSAFQAVVLVLFNQAPDDILSYEQISQATGLKEADLERTLQSLAMGKARVLIKAPKGKDVKKTDTFCVNKTFSDPKYRIKINQVQLKETKEENKETHERVAADRVFETQAAIVRIMKSRKTLTHPQLVAEVINQTKSRGAVDAGDIKFQIEKLIEKEYLEREGPSYTYLA